MQLPTLTANNYHEWKQSLDDLNYFAQWDDSVLDLQDKINTPWDGIEESSDTIAKQRRMAYAVLRMKLHPDLRHLLTGLRPGDSRGIYSRISTRFLSLTTGAIQALAEELNGFTMESSGLPIEKFGYMITQKHRMLLKVKKKQANEQTESDAIGFLLNGVLKPEFNSISIYLKMQPQDKLSDYSAVFRQLLNFAADNNLLNLKRGKNYSWQKHQNHKKNVVCTYKVIASVGQSASMNIHAVWRVARRKKTKTNLTQRKLYAIIVKSKGINGLSVPS